MRSGTRLIGLVALAALVAPARSHATEAYALPQLIRDIIVSSDVVHGATAKRGTFEMRLKAYQGVEVYKVPAHENNGEGLDDVLVDPHTGVPDPGLPTSPGLTRFVGCMTLKIPGVVSIVNECDIDGPASIEGDPLMQSIAVQASFGIDSDGPQTNVTLSLEGTGDPGSSQADKRDLSPDGRWYGLGFEADLAQYLERTGIIVSGAMFHETHNLITVVPNTDEVVMRTGVLARSYAHRYPTVCAEGQGIPIQVLGQRPGAGTPADPLIPDFVPVTGCHPDDDIPADVPDLPLPEELPEVPVPELQAIPLPEIPDTPLPI